MKTEQSIFLNKHFLSTNPDLVRNLPTKLYFQFNHQSNYKLLFVF